MVSRKRARAGATRREFLSDAARIAAGAPLALAAGSVLGGCFPDVGGRWAAVTPECAQDGGTAPEAPPSRVVEVFREDSVITETGIAPNPAAMRPMLEAGLAALAGGASSPWQALLPGCGPETRIGIKVNCLNPYLSTSAVLVKALIESLVTGLPADPARITVWDRRLDELTRAGFTAEALGVTVAGTWNSTSDHGGPGYTNAICGVVAGATPKLSRILTEQTDVTINVPVLKTHVVSGITATFKNVYGVIDNPGEYHGNANEALPALYALPPVRRSFRLTIVDALIAVVTGGTSDPPDAQPRRLLFGADPVALDAYCVTLVNSLRAEATAPPGDVDPSLLGWLERAEQAGLGTRGYELVRVTA